MVECINSKNYVNEVNNLMYLRFYSGITVADSILIVTDALKAALQNSKEAKTGGNLQQAIEKR